MAAGLIRFLSGQTRKDHELMETRRFILIIALSLVGLMLWQEWQTDYGRTRPSDKPAPQAQRQPIMDQDTGVARQQSPVALDLPAAQPPQGTDPTPAASDTLTVQQREPHISVSTDVLQLQISLRGATISRVALPAYPIDKRVPDEPVLLLDGERGDGFHILQSGLLSEGRQLPNHSSRYRADQDHYVLGDAQTLKVDLYWEGDELRVTRSLVFRRGSYLVESFYVVENLGADPLEFSLYAQQQRTEPRQRDSFFIYTYTGAVISTPEDRYRKVDFADMREEKLSLSTSNAWIALLQHYFVTALLPPDSTSVWNYYAHHVPEKNSYLIGMISPWQQVPAAASVQLGQRVYIGPKTQRVLRSIADGLELTVDYGFLWFICKFLFWVLEHLFALSANWGWSIVLLTLLIKLAFYHLSAVGYRSLANMRRIQPRIMAIRERFRDDRQQLNQAMMEIYRKEKINPLSGCFPILVQIPVFIALYWVLLESVELRQAEFIFWIDDLSAPDRFYVLPLVMGLTMYVQQKLNPPPMDPVQEKILSFLPVVFTVFFAFFPSGLVLYWVVNNILSIIQQWVIMRGIERSAAS